MPKSESDNIELEESDICVDDSSHPGNQVLQDAAQKSLENFADDDFGPEIYKHIKKQLKGKRFLASDGSQWRQASKLEIRDAVEKAFNHARDS